MRKKRVRPNFALRTTTMKTKRTEVGGNEKLSY